MRGKITITELKRRRYIDFYEYLTQTYFKKHKNETYRDELLFIEKNWTKQIRDSADKLISLPTFKTRYKLRIKLIQP